MKEMVTVTAKVQIYLGEQERKQVLATGCLYRMACNEVSKYLFDSGCMNFYEVNGALYHSLREKYGLKSQMSQSVIKTVIAKYRTVKCNGHGKRLIEFKANRYDLVHGRDWSFTNGRVSINTVKGRVKVPFATQGMEKYLDAPDCKYGTATIVVHRDGKAFLHVPVTLEVEKVDSPSTVVGIDRGIRKLAVAYDGKKTTMYSGNAVKNRRAHFSRLRKELQQRQTPSARRRLKAIGNRENSWMRDVNHCVSKALVESNPGGTLFVLEDLKGIRGATERVRVKDRYVSVSWAYYDLEQKLTYKAALAGQKVVKVDPKYTSQRCPVCGCVDKHSRDKSNHVYKCSHCGYQSNDDRIAAMNLYQLGLEYLKGTEHPRIQSPSGRPGDGGCSQPPCDVTPRPKGRKKVGAQPSVRTTGQSQAHKSSVCG